uniref:Long-chain-alcohol oxidase n=1 Tax=Oryza meridionalis TaxID=40149 RepID=A0A0E0EYU9_9ORYZ
MAPHPLLRGGARRGRKYAHGMHPVQMEALRAMCGALIPSLPVDADGGDGGRRPGDKDLERFYLASAADSSIPDEVGRSVDRSNTLCASSFLFTISNLAAAAASVARRGVAWRGVAELLVTRCIWEAVALTWVVLWALSTRVGTLLLCGRDSVVAVDGGGGFPFVSVRRFADMPAARREAALRRWSGARWLFFPLRIAFAIAKILCHYVFYSMVNENSENPYWKAIGYRVEEPRRDRTESMPTPTPTPSPSPSPATRRPLDIGVVETRALTDTTLLRSLAAKGLAVRPGASDEHHTVRCDAVIVGSGCGGGVAAAVLASAGYKVVVVEKGDYFTKEDYSSIEGPSMERLFESGGVFCTSNVTTMIFTGATVGGGSAVNWSASIRTPAGVTQEWSREHGLAVFASPGYARAMDAVCARLGVTDACREEGFQNKVVRRGCDALGLRADAVPRNSSEGHFCGSCNFGCPTGDKKGTDTTWLVDAVERGAVILTGCKAEHFIVESNGGGGRSKRCVGLVAACMSNGITKKLRVEAKVSISACGALMTPPLLHKSGLKNRHIGRNLHLHPVSMAWGYFPDNAPEPHIPGKCYEGGIITSMHRVTDRTIIETPALGPGAFAALVPWESGRDMKERMRRYARTAHAFALVRDRGAGAVDGEGRVRFSPSRDDAEELRAGLRRALRILVAAGAAEVGTHRSDGLRLRCKGVRDADVEAFLDEVTVEKGPMHSTTDKWSVLCSAHQMGSCRMGASPRDGAVDAAGESWEAEGLYVCDGSLLPTAVGCYEGGIITSMHRVTDRTIIETPALGPGAFAALVPWESGRDMKERMRRYARTAHAFALVRDRGAGSVDGEGRVRYAPSRGDTEELRAGLRRALRILVAAGAAEVGTHRSDGLRLRCKGVRDADVEAFLDEVTVEKGPMHSTTDKWSVLCSAHQMGSCRMGASPRDGAVDAAGESWEAEGLYVCDGSLLPTAVGVNPMITIQSIAYCVAKGIADSMAHGKEQR